MFSVFYILLETITSLSILILHTIIQHFTLTSIKKSHSPKQKFHRSCLAPMVNRITQGFPKYCVFMCNMLNVF